MTADSATRKIQPVKNVTGRVLLSLAVLMLLAVVTTILSQYAAVDFSVPVLVFLAGTLGGFISIQRRLKQLDEADLKLMSDSWVYTALSPAVGGILALLLYLLFLSGLMAGDLFPKFQADDAAADVRNFRAIFSQHGVAYPDYAKLLFWAFVAGFSERLVVDIISRFEREATAAGE